MPYGNDMSVFVQIPAYRDWELSKTVEDAIKKASGKNKISFGIHNCVIFPGEVPIPKSTVDWAQVKYQESIGPNNIGLQGARYIANEFYDDEDYYLQIDSHMRFSKNWDETLILTINKYKELGINKPLITQYPPNYGYDDGFNERFDSVEPFINTRISFHENPQQFKERLLPVQTAVAIDGSCGYTTSVSGGFIFTLGEFAKIKPNVKIAFWGEEPLIAARAYTHGFDLVMPMAPFVWHLYHSGQPFYKTRRHHVWADYPELWSTMDVESKEEYQRIFKNRVIGPEGLGSERTLEEYEEFSGLNFKTGTITQVKI